MCVCMCMCVYVFMCVGWVYVVGLRKGEEGGGAAAANINSDCHRCWAYYRRPTSEN